MNFEKVTHCIFDFDGTISWLRSGWPDVMAEMFVEYMSVNDREKQASKFLLRREILALNGKPSIYQMERFHELSSDWGWSLDLPSPDELLRLYLIRLDGCLAARKGAIVQNGNREQFLILGVLDLLEWLKRQDVVMFILSGTAENDVKREADLLGIHPFFGERIHGSQPGCAFSKRDVIQRILSEEKIGGDRLLAFGDGPVEILFTKEAGGMAIGVASDEDNNGSGLKDPDKELHLQNAGADLIIPDYRGIIPLLERGR